jgi:RNA polymerase primary sigma factor
MSTLDPSTKPDKWEESDETITARGGAESVSYLNQLTRQRQLTLSEEIDLSTRALHGDTRARDRLVEANMRLVLKIARNYHYPLVPFEDLVQEGAIGLMMAAERFDASKGYRFSTYATYWIRQAISRAIDNKAKTIRLPAHACDTLRKLEAARDSLTRELGIEPSTEQLARVLGIAPRKVSALLQASQEPVSLDMLVGAEENTTLASLLNDQAAANPQERVLSEELQIALSDLLAILTPRERQIMQSRFGFETDSAQGLQDIGETMNISRERVRQIELQALRKLKFAAKRKNLVTYFSE